MKTSAVDLREWVRQRRLAETREKAESQDRAPDPVQALTRGLGLIAYARALDSSGDAPNPVSAEDLLAYRRWARVRRARSAA